MLNSFLPLHSDFRQREDSQMPSLSIFRTVPTNALQLGREVYTYYVYGRASIVELEME